jgi:hypothetical protein
MAGGTVGSGTNGRKEATAPGAGSAANAPASNAAPLTVSAAGFGAGAGPLVFGVPSGGRVPFPVGHSQSTNRGPHLHSRSGREFLNLGGVMPAHCRDS